MCGAERGLVEHIYGACGNACYLKPLDIHSIIHQKVLCRKYNTTGCY